MDAGPFPDPVLEYVKQMGGSSILVTDHQAAGFSHRADHEFHLMRGADQTYRTLTTPTALSYAFELAIFHLDPARCAKALSTFDDLASRFGGGSSPALQDTQRLTSRVNGVSPAKEKKSGP